MGLFCLLLPPKPHNHSLTDLCSDCYHVAGLNNISPNASAHGVYANDHASLSWMRIHVICCRNCCAIPRMVSKQCAERWNVMAVALSTLYQCALMAVRIMWVTATVLAWACVHQGARFKQDAVSLSVISGSHLKSMEVIVSLWNHRWTRMDLEGRENRHSPFQDVHLWISFPSFSSILSLDSLWGQRAGRRVTAVCFSTIHPALVTSLPFLIQLPTLSLWLFSDSFAIHRGRVWMTHFLNGSGEVELRIMW